MGKEPLTGWNHGQAFLSEEELEKYSYDLLQRRLKENKKKINDTMKGFFHMEWDNPGEGTYEGAYKRRMDMVEDLLEYVHRIERVLERRGYRARPVRENINFERGSNPAKSLDIGRDRKVKRGDRVTVRYKGEPMNVTALDDESTVKDRVMVRSPHMGMPAEYNTYNVREFDFKDDDGDICFAELRDHLGKDYWEVPEYPKRKDYWDEELDE